VRRNSYGVTRSQDIRCELNMTTGLPNNLISISTKNFGELVT
jgi:hypothetical protein